MSFGSLEGQDGRDSFSFLSKGQGGMVGWVTAPLLISPPGRLIWGGQQEMDRCLILSTRSIQQGCKVPLTHFGHTESHSCRQFSGCLRFLAAPQPQVAAFFPETVTRQSQELGSFCQTSHVREFVFSFSFFPQTVYCEGF